MLPPLATWRWYNFWSNMALSPSSRTRKEKCRAIMQRRILSRTLTLWKVSWCSIEFTAAGMCVTSFVSYRLTNLPTTYLEISRFVTNVCGLWVLRAFEVLILLEWRILWCGGGLVPLKPCVPKYHFVLVGPVLHELWLRGLGFLVAWNNAGL